METETNKSLVRRYIEEVWNKGDLSVVDELVAPDLVNHAWPTVSAGSEGVRQAVTLIRTSFPDNQTTIEDMVAEGDRVVVRWVDRGMNRRDFVGIPATNKMVTLTGINIYRIENSKIAENWHQSDALGFFKQLGVVS